MGWGGEVGGRGSTHALGKGLSQLLYSFMPLFLISTHRQHFVFYCERRGLDISSQQTKNLLLSLGCGKHSLAFRYKTKRTFVNLLSLSCGSLS